MGCTSTHPGVLAALVLAAVALLQAQDGPRQPHTYFREQVELTDDQIQEIENGTVLAKVVDTGEKAEVVIFGATYVRASMEAFVDRFRDVERFAELHGYLGVGRFSDPPSAGDVAQLVLDEKDVEALKACKPGDCDVQLPTASMREFHQAIDWSSPQAAEQVNALAREKLVDLIDRYKAGGNQALGVYQDKDYDLAVGDAFKAVLGRVEGLSRYLPNLRTYLLDYPKATLTDTDDFFYWEKVDFGLRPTVRANHVVIHRPPELPNSPYVVANKQLYASHYFQVAVDLWLCIKDTANPDKPGFFLITEKGSRQHGLTGFKGSVARRIVVPRARDSMRKGLDELKRELESSSGA